MTLLDDPVLARAFWLWLFLICHFCLSRGLWDISFWCLCASFHFVSCNSFLNRLHANLKQLIQRRSHSNLIYWMENGSLYTLLQSLFCKLRYSGFLYYFRQLKFPLPLIFDCLCLSKTRSLSKRLETYDSVKKKIRKKKKSSISQWALLEPLISQWEILI